MYSHNISVVNSLSSRIVYLVKKKLYNIHVITVTLPQTIVIVRLKSRIQRFTFPREFVV